jgi:hypothetical protein
MRREFSYMGGGLCSGGGGSSGIREIGVAWAFLSSLLLRKPLADLGMRFFEKGALPFPKSCFRPTTAATTT